MNLPRLALAPPNPDFDEAVITIDGHEEETITVACPNARAIAAALVELVNDHIASHPEPQAAYAAGPAFRAFDC